MSTMRLIERLLLLHTVGCRLVQPGFSKQGTSSGIRPPSSNQSQPPSVRLENRLI